MAVRIERTDGLVLMSTEELLAEVGRQTGDIVIRMSAEVLKKPGAFFQIRYQSDVPYDPTLPVRTAWDLGCSDAMTVTFVQP